MRYCCLAMVVMLCTSCGPAGKLRRAQRLIHNAIMDGAKVDTTYKMVDWKAPKRTLSEKLIVDKDWNQLLVKGKDSIAFKIKRIPGPPGPGSKDTVYIEGDCPEVKGQVKAPVSVDISAGHSNWDMIILSIVCLLFGTFIGGPLVRTFSKKD